MARIKDVAVLNTIAGAADVSLLKGQVALSAATETANPLTGSISPVPHADIVSWTDTDYNVGVATILKWDYAAVALVGGVQYSVVLTHNGVDKTYSVVQAVAYATAQLLVNALVAKINLDGNASVVASSGAANELTLTQKATNISDGAVSSTNNSGAVVVAGTAYVAPAGTPEEVLALKPAASVSGGTYNKHSIVWNQLVSHNAVSGLKVYREVETIIYSNTVSGSQAAFETELEATLDATKIAAFADVILYMAK